MAERPRIYIAPAAGGKTAYLVKEAHRLAQGLAATPRVVVPSRLQVQAWRQRLADAGGALNVRVGTFEDLYHQILHESGEVFVRLSDPVQFRLLRALLDETSLTHYAPLRTMPGFVQVVRGLIEELKAGGIFPKDLTTAVKAMGDEPRVMELAQLYEAYQRRLQQEGWADDAGIGWLASEALERDPALGADWSHLMIDSFDDLTTVQLQIVGRLAQGVANLVITLTGTLDGSTRPLVHRRFDRTRRRLEKALGVKAEPLPSFFTRSASALAHLERTVFAGDSARQADDGSVNLIAAPDREAEVHSALRWLKMRLVRDGMRPKEVALLYRNLDPYRAFINQTAAEYGLLIRIVDGVSLCGNPVVAALFRLLQLALPGEGCLAWRPTVDSWRSPYFDWSGAPLPITLQDAEALDWVARWGSVVGGLDQWDETFAMLCEAEAHDETLDLDGDEISEFLPIGEEAAILSKKFHWFVERITPPEGRCPCRDFVSWLEDVIGEIDEGPDMQIGSSLGVMRQAANASEGLAERDRAALEALKDVLRGLVMAEEAVGCAPLTFDRFLDDLQGAVDAATYRVSMPSDSEGILVVDVAQARGLSFRAVALLGLAEGEFPQTVTEDPFLRDADRRFLREQFGLALDLSTESADAEYFYEAITRPREALLMTRPRIADNGSPWQPSPYWEEVRRRLDVTPGRFTTQNLPSPNEAASWPEVVRALAATAQDAAWAWLDTRRPALCRRIERAQGILAKRTGADHDAVAYDGDLQRWGQAFENTFAPHFTWSPSALESYRLCPLFFFFGRVLGLEPRRPPAEGLDARQLGNIYHRIFEQLYRRVGVDADLEALQAALPHVAQEVLDAAPQRERFRATAWWRQTRQEIVENVARSLEVLENLSEEFVFYRAEQTFGIPGEPGAPLTLYDGDDALRIRGYIDRVDRTKDGRIRVIDYKTAGPYSYTKRAIAEGAKLQLPLYALAAQEALGLGEVVEGFYWHVRHASRSRFSLRAFGPSEAMALATGYVWETARSVRKGCFIPQVPDDGCPDYCPAADFCWHFSSRGW